MFNLERAIKDWRAQMLAAGIKAPVPLDELESHLRDEMERQMKAGDSAQKAFENAVEKIGCANAIKIEFEKTSAKKLNRWQAMRRMGSIGLIGVVILNLAGRFVFHRDSSIYFSTSWWEAWSSSYLIWGFFLITGFIGGKSQLNKIKEQK